MIPVYDSLLVLLIELVIEGDLACLLGLSLTTVRL
jgi:hypothetical protein